MTSTLIITHDNGVDYPITITLQLRKPQQIGDSPTPNVFKKTKKRAIVTHEIATAEFDVGEDMGQYAMIVDVNGRSQQDIETAMDSISDRKQFNVFTGQGAITLYYLAESANNTQAFYESGFTLKSYSVSVDPGTVKWWTYTMQFIQFAGQSL